MKIKLAKIAVSVFVLCFFLLSKGCKQDNTSTSTEPQYGQAIVLFDGTNLDNWQFREPQENNKWVIGTAAATPRGDGIPRIINTETGEGTGNGELINLATTYGEGIDIYTKEEFGDCRLELELMVSMSSNSGIYLMGEYEVQVANSYGSQRLTTNTMGAISNTQIPSVNACKEPGQWQKFVIDFQTPRFNTAGEKIQNAKFLKVELNEQVIIENCEVPDVILGGLTGQESNTGPLMLQGDHGSVAYRNITVRSAIN